MHIQRIGRTFVVWYMLAIVSVGVADASTIEEVARCRAIAKRSEMVACFKALKEGKPAKTEDAAPASAQGAVSTKKDETAPAKTGGAASTNAEGAASSKREDIAPGKGGSAPPNAVPRSAPDEPETTSSINRQRAASDRPLCVDRDALAGMLVAGLLTSDQRWRLHGGCQTLPSDAKLKILERYPTVFSFMRVIAVKVTSPTRPDLTTGFTIEVDSAADDGPSLKAPQ
jgi:hypothetical protein